VAPLLPAEDVEQAHGAKQPYDSEEMIGVPVGKEDVPESEAHSIAHHLALGPFAAIEQHRLSLALDRDGGDVALDGGAGGSGAQEGQGKQGREDSEHGRREKGDGRREIRVPSLPCRPCPPSPNPTKLKRRSFRCRMSARRRS